MTAQPPAGKLPSILSIPLHPCDCGDAEECDCPMNPPAGRMTIRIPGTPDACLSPNASWRIHWGTKTRARRELSTSAFYAAKEVVESSAPISERYVPPGGAVRVKTVIAWEKGRKRMDGDNALASLKVVFDALTLAGVWVDDRYCEFEPVKQIRDKAGVGYIEVTVCAAER